MAHYPLQNNAENKMQGKGRRLLQLGKMKWTEDRQNVRRTTQNNAENK